MKIEISEIKNVVSKDDSSLYPTTKEEYEEIKPLAELIKRLTNSGD